MLAFEVPDVKPDGRFHPVTVKVNRPDVRVRTRKGYYADAVTSLRTADGATASLDELSLGLLPERGLPMSVAAATFRGPKGTPVVLLTTGVRADVASKGAALPRQGTPQFEPVEILTSAFRDGEKNVDWQRQRLSIAIPEAAPGELRYESVSTLALTRGTYEVRVISRQQGAGLVGSVHTFVDVPDFDGEPLTLSGPVLFDSHSPIATPPESLGGLLDRAPTTRRDFRAADDVSALVRVYQRRQDKAAPVAIVFRILEGTRVVTSVESAVSADQLAERGAADAAFTLPLYELESGAYILHVEATGNGATTRRDVRFTVR